MNRIFQRSLTAAALVAPLLLAGCASSVAPMADASGSPTPIETYSEPYRIGPLDSLVITKKSGSATTLQVTVDDQLEYPDGERLRVLGKSPDAVTSEIEQRDANVTSVVVNEYKGNRISVTGEVNIQTNFDLQDAPMHVLDAIASAGGFTPLAKTSCVHLVRHESGKVEVYCLNMHEVQEGKSAYQDMLLKPGDHIYVPKSFL